MAHIDLAKAEAAAIGGEIGKFAGLAGAAFILVVFAVFLAVIGVTLSLGELVLGSMGWGVIQGVLFFIALAITAILIALGVSAARIGRSFLIAAVLGLIAGIVLGLDLPNQAYRAIGEALDVSVDRSNLPLVVGAVIWAAVGLLVGIVLAYRTAGSIAGRIGVLLLSTLVGAGIGAFTAITFGPQVGAAIGITVGYIMWIVLMLLDIARTGIDVEALKLRFYPTSTIDTSKETLEWLQKRMPPGIGS